MRFTEENLSVDNTELKIEDKLLKIYPNPSHDYITLEYRTDDKYSSLTLRGISRILYI